MSVTVEPTGNRNKLYLTLSGGGIEGLILPVSGGDEVRKISSVWECPEEEILSRIENAVFDNPELLEDIPARIIVDTPRLMLFPEELEEENLIRLMEITYNASPEDFFISDVIPGVKAAYSLCKRLRGFVTRTFPGIPVTHHILPVISKYISASGERMYIAVEDDRVDICVMRGSRIICAVSHKATNVSDKLYFILFVFRTYGLDVNEAQIFFINEHESRAELIGLLRKKIRYVRISPRSSFSLPYSLSPAVSILYKSDL